MTTPPAPTSSRKAELRRSHLDWFDALMTVHPASSEMDLRFALHRLRLDLYHIVGQQLGIVTSRVVHDEVKTALAACCPSAIEAYEQIDRTGLAAMEDLSGDYSYERFLSVAHDTIRVLLVLSATLGRDALCDLPRRPPTIRWPKRQVKLGGILCSSCHTILARPSEVEAHELVRNRPACWCPGHRPKQATQALLSRDGRLLGVTLPPGPTERPRVPPPGMWVGCSRDADTLQHVVPPAWSWGVCGLDDDHEERTPEQEDLVNARVTPDKDAALAAAWAWYRRREALCPVRLWPRALRWTDAICEATELALAREQLLATLLARTEDVPRPTQAELLAQAAELNRWACQNRVVVVAVFVVGTNVVNLDHVRCPVPGRGIPAAETKLGLALAEAVGSELHRQVDPDPPTKISTMRDLLAAMARPAGGANNN